MWFLFFLSTAMAAPCDRGAVQEIVEALDEAPGDMRASMATMGIAQACTGSPGLTAAALALVQSPPDYAPMLDAKAVLDDPHLWLKLCPNGLEVAQTVVQVAPQEKRGVLWSGCNLADTHWFSGKEWSAATGTAFVPLMAGQALRDSRIQPDVTRTVVRALAGIGGSSRSPARDDAPLMFEPPSLPVDIIPVEAGWGDLEPSPAATKAGFVERPSVKWRAKARKSGKRVCRLEITVRKSGALGKVDWSACPEALRKDVEKALNKASYRTSTQNGVAVRSSFRTRFKIR